VNELVGKYLNGFRIAKIEKDPFIENQINLWTDETEVDFLGNRKVVKFYIRDYPSGASIYQEQVDKEIARLNNVINELENYLIERIEYNDGSELQDYLVNTYSIIYSVLQELKGDSSNE